MATSPAFEQVVGLELLPLHLVLVLQLLQHIVDPGDLRRRVDGGVAQHRQHELLHRPVLIQDCPLSSSARCSTDPAPRSSQSQSCRLVMV